MLVEEKMLVSFRKNSSYDVDVRQLPREWFSGSGELLGSEWRASGSDPSKLAVTPVLAFTRWVPILHPGYEWHALWHQSGAHTCNCVAMIATPLRPRPDVLPALNAIARRFYYADNGHFDRQSMNVSLIINYVAELEKLGLDCEASWRLLEESIYPIDATQDNLDRICLAPPRLAPITRWGEDVPRFITDPAILLLTENSD